MNSHQLIGLIGPMLSGLLTGHSPYIQWGISYADGSQPESVHLRGTHAQRCGQAAGAQQVLFEKLDNYDFQIRILSAFSSTVSQLPQYEISKDMMNYVAD